MIARAGYEFGQGFDPTFICTAGRAYIARGTGSSESRGSRVPRIKPPFPASRRFRKPTVLNNIETLAVEAIVDRGGLLVIGISARPENPRNTGSYGRSFTASRARHTHLRGACARITPAS